MNRNKLYIPVELTHGKGLPAIWEEGGMTRSGNGEAVIIANHEGLPKRPVTIKDRYNGRHALIPVDVGDHVIRVSRAKSDVNIFVGKIATIEDEEYAKAICDVLAVYNGANWEGNLPKSLEAAVQAAKAKSQDVLCSKPFFVEAF